MKNFYEATVIKPTLTLEVLIKLEPVDHCECTIGINDNTIFTGVISDPKNLIHRVPLTSELDFKVDIKREHPQALIVSILIDGFEVIPKYLHLAEPQTNYLNTNGVWKLHVPNFYPWYHNITGQGWIA